MEKKLWTYDSILDDVATTPFYTEYEMEMAKPKLEYFGQLLKVYWNAQEEAKQFGFVGVGCITYAEQKLAEYQLVQMEMEKVL